MRDRTLLLKHTHEVRNGLTKDKIVVAVLCWYRWGKGYG
jgi:hypothetical protein